jgi:hypothetical protein
LWEIFYAGEITSTYNFQVSPLAKLQAFTFGRLGVVSLTIFVIVLCLGFALGLGFCSGVENQKNCGKLSWIGYWGFHLGFRRKSYTCLSTSPDSVPTSFFYSKLLRSSGEESLYIGRPFHWGYDREK